MVLAMCLPVSAEILIYKVTSTGQQLDVSNQDAENKSDHGYMVLDADLSNPAEVLINEAYYLSYVSKAGVKTQSTLILDPQNVELIVNAHDGSKSKMILRWFDSPTGTYTVAAGTAKSTDIGGDVQLIASSAKGSSVWRLQGYMTGNSSISLKLDSTNTKSANTQGKSALDVLESLSQYLDSKGYRTDL